MDDCYLDIINMPHHVSKNRKQMSLHDRAAQFAPFSALTGYYETLTETERLTDERKELSEDEKEKISLRLSETELPENRSRIYRFTYFVPDERKSGGAYISREASVKRIDRFRGLVILDDHGTVAIDDIYGIEDTEEKFTIY